MFTFIMFFTISFIYSKRASDNRIQRKKEQKRIQQEKEEVIHFVEGTLYHNQLTSIHYINYHDDMHLLQIQYQARFYEVRIKKLIGVDEFTYQIVELPSQQMTNHTQSGITKQVN